MRIGICPSLAKLEIGCVQYLNAKPLIQAYDGKVCFEHPSRLAEALAKGTLDVALVPIFELLRSPDYYVADGVSISSKGRVYSVFMAYRGRLREIRKVSMDMASLTSVHLLRCVLSEFHGMTPEYVPANQCGDEVDARLLIGNQAIDFRRAHGDEYHYLDLGLDWMKHTGLPFVFAAWLMRRSVPDPAAAAGELRDLKRRGVGLLPEIVAGEGIYGARFAKRYLTHYVHFDLGDEEKKGIEKFRELLAKAGFIENSGTKLDFV